MFGRNKPPLEPRRVTQESRVANVFSYHASRSRAEVSVGRNIAPRQNQRSRWKYLPSYIALAAIAISLIYVSTLDTNPRIIITGPEEDKTILQATAAYQKAAQEELRRSISSRSKLMINTNIIASRLKKRFPELNEIAVTIPIGARRPIIELQPAHPTILLTSRSGTFVLDDNGRALIESNRLITVGSLELPVVTDESSLSVKPGSVVFPSGTGKFIEQVITQLQAKSLVIETITLPIVANELHIRLQGKGYFVKFNMSGDARLQAGTLIAVKEKLEAEKKTPAEYIDVRVEEKAFYK